MQAISGFNHNKVDWIHNDIKNFYDVKLIGFIKHYDYVKKSGTVFINEINREVYFKLDSITKNYLDNIYEYDVVYCTIGENAHGSEVKTLDGLVEGRNDFQRMEICIKKYLTSKGYGFAYLENSSKDAYFHKSAFPESYHNQIVEGDKFIAEVRLKDDGSYFVRRCLNVMTS
jgi:cold shock CspA family protein